MAYYVRTPGTCGEFIQGSIQGQRFLVTCPINRYSYAISDVQHPLPISSVSLQSKAYKAYQSVKKLLGVPDTVDTPIYLHSDILQGKGLASSSADISVVAMATALSYGYTLSMDELSSLCLSIEPSDAPFYQGIVQFDYIQGACCDVLGTCPPMRIAIFDEGGTIDTIQFNHQKNLPQLIDEKEEFMVEALAKFKEGIQTHNVKLIGEASTISSFANQRILHKASLYDLHQIGVACNAIGTIIAHSGTILGLLFPPDSPSIGHCIQQVRRELSTVTYIDTVETTNEGITFMQR